MQHQPLFVKLRNTVHFFCVLGAKVKPKNRTSIRNRFRDRYSFVYTEVPKTRPRFWGVNQAQKLVLNYI